MDPRFPTGLPFPVPEILEFVAFFRDSGKKFQQFSRSFPGTFLQNSCTDPGNSHSLLEFSEIQFSNYFCYEFGQTVSVRKIRAPIKIKSALPPPQNPPPKKGEFYGHRFSCRKNAFFQVSIKLAHPFPAPELRTRILRTRGFF